MDPKDYQWQFKDRSIKTVDQLTIEELRVALCSTMDMIEEMDGKMFETYELINKWRNNQ